jgi:hypothetical protein
VKITYVVKSMPTAQRADRAFPGTAGVTFQVDDREGEPGYIRFVPYQHLFWYRENGVQITE